MKEINAIIKKKNFLVTTRTNHFMTEFKNHEENRSTGV